MKKTISVIITCHDLEDYLGECIDSIKAQLEYPHEIILVHDGCKKFVTYTDTVCVLVEKNIGVAKARMMGAKIATGDYITFIDADDKIPEVFLLEMQNKIKTGKEIIYPDCVVWCSWGNSALKNTYCHMPVKLEWDALSKQNWVLVSSLIPRQLFMDLGGFKEYRMYEDWEFFQRAFLHKVKFIKAFTWLSYRQRTTSRNRQPDTVKQEITQKIKEDIQKYKKKYIKQ